jgi:hypothetical protein
LCVVRDPELRRTLQRTLHAAGSTVEFADADDLGTLGAAPAPDLVFLDAAARRAVDLARWPSSAIVVIGESLDDDAVLELLRRVAPHLIADDTSAAIDEQELVATSMKVLTGDLFGIEKYLAWGARIEEREVSGYDAKVAAIEAVAEFARDAGARRALVTRIESAVDELLMNALYDAPGGGRGQHESLVRPAWLRFGTDGRMFGVSVEDHYGRLVADDIVDHVTRARREGGRPLAADGAKGAGLGLYFIVTHATRIIANVDEGKRTEMICLFDLKQSPREVKGARSLHFFGRKRMARGTER